MNPPQMKACQNDRWFDDHLLWLLDNKPQWVWKKFNLDLKGLNLYLCRRVLNALNLYGRLTEKGMESNEALDWVFQSILAPPPSGNENPQPLSEEQRKKVLDWSASLAEPIAEPT